MELNFKGDELKIIQLTDLHLRVLDGTNAEQSTLELVSELARTEKPDIFVITGDLVFTADCLPIYRKFGRFMDDIGIPWAFCFGNHDRQFNASTAEIEEAICESKTCMYERSAEGVDGDGCYCIELKSDPERSPWVLYMFDSGDTINIDGHERTAHVRPTQISWFINKNGEITGRGGYSCTLAFMHIPLPEYREMWDTKPCFGMKLEEQCESAVNSGLLAAMQWNGSGKGVFVGHDHVNDYWGTMLGTRLCYGRGTGFDGRDADGSRRGAYSRPGVVPGARVIVVNRNNHLPFKTYIHLAGGEIIENQPEHQPEVK